MTIKQFLLITTLCLFSTPSFSHQINLELGRAKTLFNHFQLPNEDRNEINLPDDNTLNSYRVKAMIDLENDTFLYFLYAPFADDYHLTSDKSFTFNNSNFGANEHTAISYKFNSYRAGYFKKFNPHEKFTYWLGGVVKIRDAHIKVRQNNRFDSYENVGVVPLLGLGAQYFINDHISLFSHIDALGSSQGSAYDVNAEVRYHQNKNNAIGLGYRTFGGGVDNDELMNFARFESFYVNYNITF